MTYYHLHNHNFILVFLKHNFSSRPVSWINARKDSFGCVWVSVCWDSFIQGRCTFSSWCSPLCCMWRAWLEILIVFSVITGSHLHSPMYFLLASLSFIDLRDCSVTSPKMTYELFRKHKLIYFGVCIAQIFFIHVIGGMEMVLHIAVAFDRCVTLCKPLHYQTTMSPWICILIWLLPEPLESVTLFQLAFIVNLSFCGPNILDSFYYDLPCLLRLACTDTYTLQFTVTVNSRFICVGSFCILLITYIFILVTLRIRSSVGSSRSSPICQFTSLWSFYSLIRPCLSLHGHIPIHRWTSFLLFLMQFSLLFWIQSSIHSGIKRWRQQWREYANSLWLTGRYHTLYDSATSLTME